MPAEFRIYNTLSRSVEPFEPLVPGKLSLYVCGMTVYDHAHIGHARLFTTFDTFVRYLRHRGWQVTYVRNFTDVDDKIIKRANDEQVEAMAIAERYIASFREDMASLGLIPPDHEPRVSRSIDVIQAMVQRLVDHGHAYESGGSVWFDVRSYEEYGKLSGQNPDEMRSSPDLGVKRNALDFALWKAVKPGEPAWESPWGEGRPGWHIECSAMAYDHFGPTLDIHGGGMDLKFPHHENEIAQSCCANKANYARYWMHNGLLVLQKPPGEDGPAAKMGKSKNNAFGVRDALSQYPAEALRLHYLGTHYRTPLPWGPDSFSESLANLARLYEARDVAQSMQGSESAEDVIASLGDDAAEVYRLGLTFPERFYAAMDDDLNTAKALGAAFELARAINRFANHKKARKRGGPVVAPALDALVLLNVIGLLSLDGAAFQDEVKAKRLGAMGVSQEQVEDLLRQRAEARASKDWARADEIRAELTSLRIVVMDRADGVDWRVQLVDDE